MGYYLDFVFEDSDRSAGHQEIVERFCRAGATVFDWTREEPDMPESVKARWEKFTTLKYPRLLCMIDVYKVAPAEPAGCRAAIRLSWGHDQEEFYNILEILLDLAEKVGCRLYDGQIDQFVTKETIDVFVTAHQKGARTVVGLFGKTT